MSTTVVSTEPRVSSLELFFDLVFVFTITQLTSLLLRDPTLGGLLQMVLLFGNVWWMYGGLLMAVLALMTTFIGLRATAVAQLAALVAILIAGNVGERLANPNR